MSNRKGKQAQKSVPTQEEETVPVLGSGWDDLPTFEQKGRSHVTVTGKGASGRTSRGKQAPQPGRTKPAPQRSAGGSSAASGSEDSEHSSGKVNAPEGMEMASRGRGQLPLLTSFESTAVSHTGMTASGRKTIRTVFAKETPEEIAARREASRHVLHRCRPGAAPLPSGAPRSPPFYTTPLPIPSRPPWNRSMTAAELHRSEEAHFRAYLSNLYEKYGSSRLNHFEHNLDVWRQLWRVGEKSHILILVADARHPLLHFSPGLHSYVTKELKKPLLLLLNKIDLVPLPVLRAWQEWFGRRFPDMLVVLFSSFPSAAHRIALAEEASRAAAAASGTTATAAAAAASAADDEQEHESGLTAAERAALERALLATTNADLAAHAREVGRRKRSPLLDPVGADALLAACRAIVRERGVALARAAPGAIAPAHPHTAAAGSAEAGHRKAGRRGSASAAPTAAVAPVGEEDAGAVISQGVSFTASRLLSARDEENRKALQRRRAEELEELRARLRAQAGGVKAKKQEAGAQQQEEEEEEGLFGKKVEDAAAEAENEDENDDDVDVEAFRAMTLDGKKGAKGAKKGGKRGKGRGGIDVEAVGDDLARLKRGETGGNRRMRARLAGLAAVLGGGESGESSEEEDDGLDEEEAEAAAVAAAGGVLLTIGTVGHPNAGKSSVINALTGKKVVSVSRQPGHTKIIQPLKINASTVLCDCPGLIFPAVDVPRPLQVLAGIYPIPQTREFYSAVQYLAERLPLEDILGITPPPSDDPRAPSAPSTTTATPYPWSAWTICERYAAKRGFEGAYGRLDAHRAAQAILYAVADGHLPFYFAPPDEAESKGAAGVRID